MTTIASLEKGLSAPRSVETSKLIVRQPSKLAELSKLLETFDNLDARVGERVGEDRSGDLGGGTGATGGQQGDDATSPRDKAIQAMPVPAMQRQRLEAHIHKEMQKLSHQASSLARSSKPGAAYKLNNLYSRIRRLNSLLTELLEAAEEVLRRLFIRVFIDHQSIV